MAFADDHKQLSLWEWQDNAGLKLIKQWNLMRRANKIIFDHRIRKEYPDDDEHILIAGKKIEIHFNILWRLICKKHWLSFSK